MKSYPDEAAGAPTAVGDGWETADGGGAALAGGGEALEGAGAEDICLWIEFTTNLLT